MNFNKVSSLIEVDELKSIIKENKKEMKKLSKDDWLLNFVERMKNNYDFSFTLLNEALFICFKKENTIDKILKCILYEMIFLIVHVYSIYFITNKLFEKPIYADISFIELFLFGLVLYTSHAFLYYKKFIPNSLLVVKKSLQKRKKALFFLKINHLMVSILSFLIVYFLFVKVIDLNTIVILLIPFLILNINVFKKLRHFNDYIDTIECLYVIYLFLEKENNEYLFFNNFKEEIKKINN